MVTDFRSDLSGIWHWCSDCNEWPANWFYILRRIDSHPALGTARNAGHSPRITLTISESESARAALPHVNDPGDLHKRRDGTSDINGDGSILLPGLNRPVSAFSTAEGNV
jgi:hypothetical protein